MKSNEVSLERHGGARDWGESYGGYAGYPGIQSWWSTSEQPRPRTESYHGLGMVRSVSSGVGGLVNDGIVLVPWVLMVLFVLIR